MIYLYNKYLFKYKTINIFKSEFQSILASTWISLRIWFSIFNFTTKTGPVFSFINSFLPIHSSSTTIFATLTLHSFEVISNDIYTICSSL